MQYRFFISCGNLNIMTRGLSRERIPGQGDRFEEESHLNTQEGEMAETDWKDLWHDLAERFRVLPKQGSGSTAKDRGRILPCSMPNPDLLRVCEARGTRHAPTASTDSTAVGV